jgi:hypothetical protein
MGEVRKCLCCGQAVMRGKLMCALHRRRVPRATWNELRAAWRAYKRSPDGQPAIAALTAYQQQLATTVAIALQDERAAA